MTIALLPTPPTRSDPVNFAIRADAFLAALPTFAEEANALANDVNTRQSQAAASANAAASSATNALNSETAAAASVSTAQATANVTAWSAATNYAAGVTVYDTTDFFTYRRKIAGTTATRPGLDSTNWVLISGHVTTGTDQTITGTKTFSQPIVGSITGNAATATALTDNTVLCVPGMAAFFFMNTPPTGWLKANGAAVSRTTYAALFSAIGTTYGAGDGSTTFNLPDLRGEFIRGWDDGRGVDVSRGFATIQTSANLSHTHTGSTTQNGNHTHSIAGNQGGAVQILGSQSGTVAGIGAGTSGSYVTSYGGNNIIAAVGDHAHTFTTNADGLSESRPRNIALLPCIKY